MSDIGNLLNRRNEARTATPEVRSGRHPHEIGVLIATVCIGILGVVLPGTSNPAIYDLFGDGLGRLFFAAMAAFAGLTVASIWLRRIEGLLIERIGLCVLSLFYFAYAVAVVVAYGPIGLFATAFPVCMIVSNLFRVWQIKGDLRRLKVGLLLIHDGGNHDR